MFWLFAFLSLTGWGCQGVGLLQVLEDTWVNTLGSEVGGAGLAWRVSYFVSSDSTPRQQCPLVYPDPAVPAILEDDQDKTCKDRVSDSLGWLPAYGTAEAGL